MFHRNFSTHHVSIAPRAHTVVNTGYVSGMGLFVLLRLLTLFWTLIVFLLLPIWHGLKAGIGSCVAKPKLEKDVNKVVSSNRFASWPETQEPQKVKLNYVSICDFYLLILLSSTSLFKQVRKRKEDFIKTSKLLTKIINLLSVFIIASFIIFWSK